MGEIKRGNWEKAGEPLTGSFTAKTVFENVFPNDVSNQTFVDTLVKHASSGGSIKLAGRRLRELLGCKVMDFSNVTVSDAHNMAWPHDRLRLGPLLEVLEKYPEERMTKPDLDLFTWDIDLKRLQNDLQSNGFECAIKEATGGVFLLHLETELGSITIIDGEQSWQTKENSAWPKYGVKAKFIPSSEPTFELNSMYGSMYLYPLEIPRIPEIVNNPVQPERMAVAARTLLWALTATDPEGKLLTIPSHSTQQLIFDSVYYLYSLFEQINSNPDLEVKYRGAIRDMAVALRSIVLPDWQAMKQAGVDADRANFFGRVASSWMGGYFDALKENKGSLDKTILASIC